jgi:hypothetical protein
MTSPSQYFHDHRRHGEPSSAHRLDRIAHLRNLLIVTALASCSGNDHPATDAAVLPMDASVVNVDCPTYCAEVQANCTGVNAQYTGSDPMTAMNSCMGTCQSFSMLGSLNDKAGNTLGCRLHFAIDAATTAAAADDCPRAGPIGDVISESPEYCSGGDICTSFCALEVNACGSLDTPLPNDPKDASQNSIYQYQNAASCMRQCAMLDKTHAYSPSAQGNSVACRIFQSTQAAISVMPNAIMDCADTAASPTGRCAGTATP